MNKRAYGFTIVELAVVIVVIAILASIVVVSYTSIQRKSKDVALMNDLSNASETIEVWLAKRGNSIQKLRTLYGGSYSSWIMGKGADNAVPASALRWNDVEGLPVITPSAGTTLEVVSRYSSGNGYTATDVNDRMLNENIFCLTIASPGSTYDYQPNTNVHSSYDRMLYYDGGLGKILTLPELVDLYEGGADVTCEAHVVRYLQATS